MGNWSLAEEQERKQLLAAIAHVERSMAVPASREVSTGLLTYLNSLKTRLGALEEKQKAFEEQEERTAGLQRVAAMVERETALNAAEKEQYRGFLMKEFFTKGDFSALENFYAGAYDRLTEEGKSEMSYRVWEGIRRGEFEFQEMPEVLKEKEAARLREELGAGNKDLEAIPETDRSDFINSWDAGRKKESYEVLDRPAFAKAVSLSPAVVPEKEVTTQAVKADAVQDKTNTKTAKVQTPATTPEVMGSIEFKSDDLSEVSLCTPDMKPPLSNHTKSAGPSVKTH